MPLKFKTDYKTERTVDGAPREIEDGVVAVPTMTIDRTWEDRLAQRPPDEMLDEARSIVDAMLEQTSGREDAERVEIPLEPVEPIELTTGDTIKIRVRDIGPEVLPIAAMHRDDIRPRYYSMQPDKELEKLQKVLEQLSDHSQLSAGSAITVDSNHHTLWINIKVLEVAQQSSVISALDSLLSQGRGGGYVRKIDLTRLDREQVKQYTHAVEVFLSQNTDAY